MQTIGLVNHRFRNTREEGTKFVNNHVVNKATFPIPI